MMASENLTRWGRNGGKGVEDNLVRALRERVNWTLDIILSTELLLYEVPREQHLGNLEASLPVCLLEDLQRSQRLSPTLEFQSET